MELIALKEKLSDYEIAVYGNRDLTIDVHLIKFYTEKEKKLNSNVIYLCPTNLLPSPDTPGKFSFLCYGNPLPWADYEQSSFPILYLNIQIDPLELFNQIQDLLQDILKINAGLHILINAFFTEQGLQHLTDVAYEVFGNPLFVIDNTHKHIAVSSGIISTNDLAAEENREGYISQQGIHFIRKAKIDERIREKSFPIYFKNPLHGRGMLVDSITINNIEVGHVMLYELDHPLQEFDDVMLHQTSRLISMELQKNSFINANKGFLYSYFLADLLDNPDINYVTVKERLSVLNYDLKEEQYMLVIPSRSYRNTGIRLDIIIEQLHKILTNSLYVIYENTIAILISRSKKDGIKEQEYSRLQGFLQANNLTAGISNFFYDLKEARRFYHQALKAVELGTRLGVKAPIHSYSDYYLYHIFEMCEKQENIAYFIHPGMTKLLEYDRNHGSDLIQTLAEYIETPGQPTQTAKRLNIHKNTLLYRIDKIRSITDTKFDTGDDYLSYALSHRIMKYLKMI